MDGVWSQKNWPLVDESQVQGNIENYGYGDGAYYGNSSSKLESSDHIPYHSTNDDHAPSVSEVL